MRNLAIFAGLVLTLGCMAAPTIPHVVMNRLNGGLQGPDVVVFDVAVIEQPPADPFLDGDLWTSVDEQAVALDRKAALDDNGLRVGVTGGMPGARLQELLISEKFCQAHRVSMRAGRCKVLAVGPAIADCEFELRLANDSKPHKFTQAQFGLSLVPQRTADGRVKLAVTPQVSHGGKSLWVQPAEGENWSLTGNRPVESFKGVGFEVTIAAHEYLLIGTRFDQRGTLGHLAFASTSEIRPAQRLLAIRARPSDDAPAPSFSNEKVAPLAYQASASARGTAE